MAARQEREGDAHEDQPDAVMPASSEQDDEEESEHEEEEESEEFAARRDSFIAKAMEKRAVYLREAANSKRQTKDLHARLSSQGVDFGGLLAEHQGVPPPAQSAGGAAGGNGSSSLLRTETRQQQAAGPGGAGAAPR
eukprot:tig00021135_g18946.t1